MALVALVIGIYFRDAKMSAAALLALVHDLILTIGIYALVGFTVTPATLIGVLTILGYSLYDTVVVFDKVRENVRDIRASTARTYSEAANLAVNQVLVRSINTTVIGVLPVAALLFTGAFILGEGPLKDLALALFCRHGLRGVLVDLHRNAVARSDERAGTRHEEAGGAGTGASGQGEPEGTGRRDGCSDQRSRTCRQVDVSGRVRDRSHRSKSGRRAERR
jgi:hypothetical protein